MINAIYRLFTEECADEIGCSHAEATLDAPVCGTDGISYNNECTLKKIACQQGKETKIAFRGMCQECR